MSTFVPLLSNPPSTSLSTLPISLRWRWKEQKILHSYECPTTPFVPCLSLQFLCPPSPTLGLMSLLTSSPSRDGQLIVSSWSHVQSSVSDFPKRFCVHHSDIRFLPLPHHCPTCMYLRERLSTGKHTRDGFSSYVWTWYLTSGRETFRGMCFLLSDSGTGVVVVEGWPSVPRSYTGGVRLLRNYRVLVGEGTLRTFVVHRRSYRSPLWQRNNLVCPDWTVYLNHVFILKNFEVPVCRRDGIVLFVTSSIKKIHCHPVVVC